MKSDRSIARKDFVTNTVRERFVDEYMMDLDGRGAALRTGLAPVMGSRLLADPIVQALISKQQETRSQRLSLDVDDIVRRLWILATADVRDIVRPRRVACRYCYGIDHRYQFTLDELRRAQQKHELIQRRLPMEMRTPFDDLGGDGFDGTKPPAEDCTECFGEGILSVYIEDADNFTPGAAALYGGVKVGKDGSVEFKFRDKDRALAYVMEIMGVTSIGKNNRDSIENFDPVKLTNDQLDRVIESVDRLLEYDGEGGKE